MGGFLHVWFFVGGLVDCVYVMHKTPAQLLVPAAGVRVLQGRKPRVTVSRRVGRLRSRDAQEADAKFGCYRCYRQCTSVRFDWMWFKKKEKAS